MDKSNIRLAEKTLAFLKKKSFNSTVFDKFFKKNKMNNKNYLLKNINRYFDFKLKKESKNIEGSTQKDMFFELIMIRFDILQEYRKAIINIFNFFKIRPKEFFMLLPSFIESMFLATHLSGISVKGIKGNVKIKGLLIVYFSSFLIWLKDESVSLEKTMTSLDLYLNRADKILKIFKK